MIISGEIFLYSKDGTKYKSKTFKNKTDRKKIIQSWETLYKLSRKPLYYIAVTPDLLMGRYAGYISLYIDKDFVDDAFYKNRSHRDELVDKWVNKLNLHNISYILYITPNIVNYESD